jgi:hypothetical protein
VARGGGALSSAGTAQAATADLLAAAAAAVTAMRVVAAAPDGGRIAAYHLQRNADLLHAALHRYLDAAAAPWPALAANAIDGDDIGALEAASRPPAAFVAGAALNPPRRRYTDRP